MANTIMKLLTSLAGIFSLTIVSTDVNRPENTGLKVGDKINFHDDEVVRWAGLFLQDEYKNDQTSGFFSAAVSQKTDWQNFLLWNVKGGINCNLTTKQNVSSDAG